MRYLNEGGIKTKIRHNARFMRNRKEILETMRDLRAVGVSILTIGQYLQPSEKHLPVVEFITPEKL